MGLRAGKTKIKTNNKNRQRANQRLVSPSLLTDAFFESGRPHLLNDAWAADLRAREQKCGAPEDVNVGGTSGFCRRPAHIGVPVLGEQTSAADVRLARTRRVIKARNTYRGCRGQVCSPAPSFLQTIRGGFLFDTGMNRRCAATGLTEGSPWNNGCRRTDLSGRGMRRRSGQQTRAVGSQEKEPKRSYSSEQLYVSASSVPR